MTSFWLPDETGFSYRNGALFCEDVPVTELADKYGTPSFIYSRKAIETAFRDYDGAFGSHPHHILYSVKACSNIGIISLLAKLGSGFDIVSGGELLRVEAAGGDLSKVVYSGVGKTDKEIALALEKGIHCFNIESVPELNDIARVAASLGKVAPIAVRVNPNVDAKTHPYISTGLKNNKFGVAYEKTVELYKQAAAMPSIRVVGIDCHIGSQITELMYLDHESVCTGCNRSFRLSRTLRKRSSISSISWRPKAFRSNTSTSAAVSASATRTKCRPPSANSCV